MDAEFTEEQIQKVIDGYNEGAQGMVTFLNNNLGAQLTRVPHEALRSH